MDVTAALWGLNSGLIIVLGFFVRKWICDLERKIDQKADKTTCDKTHETIEKGLHTHAHVGNAGEVIPL